MPRFYVAYRLQSSEKPQRLYNKSLTLLKQELRGAGPDNTWAVALYNVKPDQDTIIALAKGLKNLEPEAMTQYQHTGKRLSEVDVSEEAKNAIAGKKASPTVRTVEAPEAEAEPEAVEAIEVEDRRSPEDVLAEARERKRRKAEKKARRLAEASN